jgi:hypothetical protein
MILKITMKKDHLNIFIFLLIFLSILLVAYPITYVLIKTPFFNCSEYFRNFTNSITSLKDGYSDCIEITDVDVKNTFYIFSSWFVFFFIFFYFFLKF